MINLSDEVIKRIEWTGEYKMTEIYDKVEVDGEVNSVLRLVGRGTGIGDEVDRVSSKIGSVVSKY